MKKIISFFLAVLILTTTMLVVSAADSSSRSASANSGTTGDCTWEFNLETSMLSISGNGAMANYSQSNKAPWDSLKNNIVWVSIGNGVSSIGEYAFTSCVNLKKATIPDSVHRIGKYAFSQCYALLTISIPKEVSVLETYSFSNCSSVKTLSIPEGVTEIQDGVFYNCSGLTSAQLPNGVVKIGGSVFGNCTSLVSIVIPNGVKSIGPYCFNKCTKLAEISLPDSIENIEWDAFANTGYYNNEDNWDNGVLYIGNHVIKAKTDLTGKYRIKAGTVSIGGYAFYQCENLTSVIISNGVVGIGTCSFADCTSLSAVEIPNSVTGIHGSAFNSCPNLKAVAIPSTVELIDRFAFGYNNSSIVDGFTIYGTDFSKAELYAIENGINFEPIENYVSSETENTNEPTGSLSESNPSESGSSESNPSESGSSESNPSESGSSESNPSESGSSEDNPTEPNSSDTNPTDPASSEQNPTEPNSSESQPTESSSSENNTTFPSATESYPTTSITTISIKAAKSKIFVGESTKVVASVKNPKGKTTFSSNNSSVCTVNSEGKVLGKKAGTVIISAVNNGKKATVKIKVLAKIKQTITTISIKAIKTKIYVGESTKVVASVKNPKGKTTFSSNNSSVCTVNSEGKVLGKKAGTVIISAVNNGKKATVKIKVLAKIKQTISAKSYKKTYGNKAFALKAKTSGNGKLSYKSSNKKIVVVSSKGKVSIKGCGKTTITIKAASTTKFKASSKKVSVTVKPGKIKILSKKMDKNKIVKLKKGKKGKGEYKVTYSPQKNCDGYRLEVSFSGKFAGEENHQTNKPTQTYYTIAPLFNGYKYYARYRAYKIIDGKKAVGAWSYISFIV